MTPADVAAPMTAETPRDYVRRLFFAWHTSGEAAHESATRIFGEAMADARREALELAARVAENEPEPGDWTHAERVAAMAADLKQLMNAGVVVTKRNIARDIRALVAK